MKKHTIQTLKAGALICLLAASLHADAAEHGHGRISMQGSIIDTACSINMEDRYQVVEIGVQAVGQLAALPQGEDVPLVIHLENCALHSDGQPMQDWSQFRVTFDGETDDGRLFTTQGTADGIGVEIVDEQGSAAIPGEAMPSGDLSLGDLALNYRVRLKGNARHLKPGEYRAVIRFKVEYF